MGGPREAGSSGVCRQAEGPAPSLLPCSQALVYHTAPYKQDPATSPSSSIHVWGTLHLLLFIPAPGPNREKTLAAFPRPSGVVTHSHHSVAITGSTVLPLTEPRLEQRGVKPGLVYPVDVLAELLTDL